MATHAQARRYRIHGRVQGVFYRGSAKNEASKRGLVGWVRNLSDGSVEAYASGDAASLSEFEHWLQNGPRHAQVARLDISDAEFEELVSFEIR